MRARWVVGTFGTLLVGLLAISGPAAFAQADLVNAARREGRVVVYGSLETDNFEVIQKIFEGRYGIKVEYWRAASNRVLDRTLTETRAGRPQFDVVLTNRSPMLILKQAGAFGRYTAPSYEAFPAATHDRDGVLSPSYRVVVVGILYNTRQVRAEEAPRAMADLLDAKWKGKVVMPDPTQHTTTAVWLANLPKIMGQQARPFIERLAGQVGLAESFIPAAQKVIAGEYPVGLSYIKYVHVFGQTGAPLDYARVNPVLAEAHHVALAARPINPNAARLFIDTMTSRVGLLALARAGEFVLVPGVYPPIRDADKLRIVMMEDLDDQELRRFHDEVGRLFVRR
ncbi:MAG: extracellular solute-binding protein [Armatimonadota bacterium]|nr:extracellular solute-binding protein [Armatimonadota bacterium]MDR7455105.1 extracellular solute-binding protein [Armatimonadota bacterium]MDR7456054.1 extracellular solute-binding protein [Armatimonadota bacterium]MDR7495384.1 extracellular solute-binding protein [Armatimonadota bacterium]MDR7511681.1 extracellular solute-binding protein [Armatimonadota bacterium]